MTAIDAGEVAKFEAMAERWWDPRGEAAPLHRINPCRLDYVADQIAAQFGRDRRARRPFEGLSAVDVGCGGGLVAEPLARLGAATTGLDASPGAIAAARAHAEGGGLDIDYREGTAEALADQGATFDVVLALEIVEHTPDPAAFCGALARLTKPGGLAILSTLNRTPLSFALGIVAAERVLRWLPPGTHDWRRFVTPDELSAMLARAGLRTVDRAGMTFSPLTGEFRVSQRDLSVNYLLTAEKPG